MNEEQKKEKIAELKNKQESIKEFLALKEEELKKMCLREAVSGLSYFHMLFQLCQFKQSYLKIFFAFLFLFDQELTGVLPKEYPLAPGEKPPTVRRRVGTTFKLDDLFPYDAVGCLNCFSQK